MLQEDSGRALSLWEEASPSPLGSIGPADPGGCRSPQVHFLMGGCRCLWEATWLSIRGHTLRLLTGPAGLQWRG